MKTSPCAHGNRDFHYETIDQENNWQINTSEK